MNNTPTNSKQDCFAYDIRKGQCTALTAANCADCPFYKSAEQENNELKKVARRLALMGITPKVRSMHVPQTSATEE